MGDTYGPHLVELRLKMRAMRVAIESYARAGRLAPKLPTAKSKEI